MGNVGAQNSKIINVYPFKMFNVTVYRTGMYKVRILGGYDYSKTLLGPKKTELVGYRKSTHFTVYCTVLILALKSCLKMITCQKFTTVSVRSCY